jgi:hypothetical protein
VYFTLGEIISVVVVGLAGLYFMGAIRVRELAVQAVHRAGKDGDFQLLDQAVHLRRISMSRDDSGSWHVWRQYRFDYSFDGIDRRQGFVTMLGKRLQSMVVAERTETLH